MPMEDAAKNTAMSTGIVASPYGQCSPMPSPNQKSPKDETMMPTTNLSEFSGTRESGRCNDSAAPRDFRFASR